MNDGKWKQVCQTDFKAADKCQLYPPPKAFPLSSRSLYAKPWLQETIQGMCGMTKEQRSHPGDEHFLQFWQKSRILQFIRTKKTICSPSSVARFILRISLFLCVLSSTCLYCIASHFYHFAAYFFVVAIFPPDHVLENVQNTFLFSLDFKSNVWEIYFTYLLKNVVNELTFWALLKAPKLPVCLCGKKYPITIWPKISKMLLKWD